MNAQDPINTPPPTPPASPPSHSAQEVEQIAAVSGTQTFKFDVLGPVVVNTDGILSRIANWEHMAPVEKERTLRVLVARNKLRLANQEKQEDEASGEEKLSISTGSDL